MAIGPINLYEFEVLAKDKIVKSRYDHIEGGATDEITIQRNRAVYDSIMLRPRVMVDINKRDTSTTVLGHRIAFPVMLAPAGMHARAHPDGELASAQAAGIMGTVMVVSAGANYKMEETAKAATGPLWFQQYLYKDRGLTKSLAERAKAAGYTAICITVDQTQAGKRERTIRNAYVTPPSPNYAGIEPPTKAYELHSGPGGAPDLIDTAADWDYLEWFASVMPLPVVVKGIMTGDDVRLCTQHGARSVILSNHGGRQLDTTFATAEVLPEVVEAADGRVEVYVDGGIRRGTDIVKALALGARAVLIGRPLYWGLALAGEAGLREVLQILRDELDLAMAMCGRPTIASIDRSVLGTVSPLLSALRHPQGVTAP